MTNADKDIRIDDIILNIEDYVIGNIDGVDNVDYMAFTAFLREQLGYLSDHITKARINELERLGVDSMDNEDINSKAFNRWSQKDIAHFFDTVGHRYRELQAQLGEK